MEEWIRVTALSGRRSHFLPSEQRQRGSGLAMVVNGRKQSGVTNMWKYGACIYLMLWFFSHRVSQMHSEAVFHHLRNRKGEQSVPWVDTLGVLWFRQGRHPGPTLALKIIIIFSECDGGDLPLCGPAYRNSEVTWRWGGFLTEHNVIKVRGSLVVFSERGFHSPSLKSHPRGSSDVRVGGWGGCIPGCQHIIYSRTNARC